VVCRKREGNPPAATEVAMTPVSLAISNDTYNSEFDVASGLTNPATNNNQATDNNAYSKLQFPPIAGAAGGVGSENDDYDEPFNMHQPLCGTNSFNPPVDPNYVNAK